MIASAAWLAERCCPAAQASRLGPARPLFLGSPAGGGRGGGFFSPKQESLPPRQGRTRALFFPSAFYKRGSGDTLRGVSPPRALLRFGFAKGTEGFLGKN